MYAYLLIFINNLYFINIITCALNRWNKISAADVTKWNGNVIRNFHFEFFVYVMQCRTVPTGIQHATQSRIQAARLDIAREHPNLGPIATNQFAMLLARNADKSANVLPTNNTFQQAVMLDAA